MSAFEQRWRSCVRAARQAMAREGAPTAVPKAAEVWRKIQAVRGGAGSRGGQGARSDLETPGEALWRWYGLRGVAAAALLLVVSLVFAVRGGGEGAAPLRPGVEDAVAEAFWLL